MARTLFGMGFHAGSLFDRPRIGINLKTITSLIPGASSSTPTPAAAPTATPIPDTSIPPHIIALGGVGILGVVAAVIFGHK